MNTRRPRVLVIGGGPAGLAASLRLASRGVETTLADAKRATERSIGETVSSGVYATLAELGLASGFEKLPQRPMRLMCSTWGDAEPVQRDGMFSVNGPALHLERETFDAWLTASARDAGVNVLRGTRVRTLRRGTERSGTEHRGTVWHAELSHEDDKSEPREFDVIVQAAGRQSALSRRLDAGRVLRWDRLVGVVQHIPTLNEPAWQMWVETIAAGWVYFTPFGERSGVVAWMTDADLLRRGDPLDQAFAKALEQTTHIAGLARGLGAIELRVFDARSASSLAPVGDGYVLVGDAAAAYDPLSSRGIETALRGGLRAADAIVCAYRGETAALLDYARAVHQEYREYLELRQGYYALEQRFAYAPFWQRRHATPAPIG